MAAYGDDTGTAALEPLGTEEEFAALLARMVTDMAPRVLAVCEELGDRADARVLAWCVAFDDRVDLLGVDGTVCRGFASVEAACQLLPPHRKLRLVWPDPQPRPACDQVRLVLGC